MGIIWEYNTFVLVFAKDDSNGFIGYLWKECSALCEDQHICSMRLGKNLTMQRRCYFGFVAVFFGGGGGHQHSPSGHNLFFSSRCTEIWMTEINQKWMGAVNLV